MKIVILKEEEFVSFFFAIVTIKRLPNIELLNELIECIDWDGLLFIEDALLWLLDFFFKIAFTNVWPNDWLCSWLLSSFIFSLFSLSIISSTTTSAVRIGICCLFLLLLFKLFWLILSSKLPLLIWLGASFVADWAFVQLFEFGKLFTASVLGVIKILAGCVL